jgi:integrase
VHGQSGGILRRSAARLPFPDTERSTRPASATALPHPVHPHQLRHTFVTIAAQNEVPIEEVARHAGHASVQTTMSYYGALEEHSAHPTHAVLAALARARGES